MNETILLAGLFILLGGLFSLYLFYKQKTSVKVINEKPSAFNMDHTKKYRRIHFSNKQIRHLKRSIRLIRKNSSSAPLGTHSDYLLSAAHRTAKHCKHLPSMPFSPKGLPRVLIPLYHYLQENALKLDRYTFADQLKKWSSQYAFTNDELIYLPLLLRIALLLQITAYACSVNQEEEEWQTNAVNALKTIDLIPWDPILEDMNPLHAILAIDETYVLMDAESRAFYRSQAAFIAKRIQIPESTVCSEAIFLASANHSIDSLETHVGFFLLDEGLALLLKRLNAENHFRFRLFFEKQKALISTVFLWLCFLVFFAFGYFNGYAIVMLAPFAAVMTALVQRFAFPFLSNHCQTEQLPRIEVPQITKQNQILVVMHAKLETPQQAVDAVNTLLVMHEANPDDNIHFLLLGEPGDSLTAVQVSDSETIQAAATSVAALRAQSGHPFFYIHRKRFLFPGSKTYHSADRSYGGLETILKLINGSEPEEEFAFSSIDPEILDHSYRYIITTDVATTFPPDSMRRLLGAIIHPLQKRCIHHGTARGYSIIRPEIISAAHSPRSVIAQCFHHAPQPIFLKSFQTAGIIDVDSFSEHTQGRVPAGRLLEHTLLTAHLAGTVCDKDTVVYQTDFSGLKRMILLLHHFARAAWQSLPFAVPFVNHSLYKQLTLHSRLSVWCQVLQTAAPPIMLLLLIYASVFGHEGLLIVLFLFGDLDTLFPFSIRGIFYYLLKAALLPCRALQLASAAATALYRTLFANHHLQDAFVTNKTNDWRLNPYIFFYAFSITSATVSGVFAFMNGYSLPAYVPAFLWSIFPCLLPYLDTPSEIAPNLSEKSMNALLHLAQKTYLYFTALPADGSSALPPALMFAEPERSYSEYTTPESIGSSLCALLCAEKLGMLSCEDAAAQIAALLKMLDSLPDWNGLFFSKYDLRTLQPSGDSVISSAECGFLALCLLTCAQGLRALEPKAGEETGYLAEFAEQICTNMQLHMLYDQEADLFFVTIDPAKETHSEHFTALASNGQLLSYVSILLGQVPLRHWYKLSRAKTSSGHLFSEHGSLSEYMLSFLFLSPPKGSLLQKECKAVFRTHRRAAVDGIFGLGDCIHTFEKGTGNFDTEANGLKKLALSSEGCCTAITPYASLLCLPFSVGSVIENLKRMQNLGADTIWGLYDAIVFSNIRSGKANARVVRCISTYHQGLILCSVCNAIHPHFLPELFMRLPRTEAYRFLIDEPSSGFE